MLCSPWNARVFVAALVALSVAGSPRPAQASGMTSSIEFSTTGTIGTTGMVGPQIVSFQGADDVNLSTAGSAASLGHFVVQPVAAGQTTTYNQTPFDIVVNLKSADGSPATAPSPIEIKGWLNGSVSGTGLSNLGVNFIYYPGHPGDDGSPHVYPSLASPFRIGSILHYLDQTGFHGTIANGSGGGSTDLRGVLYATETVPEPTILAMFATSMGLLLLRRSRSILKK